MAEYQKPKGTHAWTLREHGHEDFLAGPETSNWQCTKCGKSFSGEPNEAMLMEPCNPPKPPAPKGAK